MLRRLVITLPFAAALSLAAPAAASHGGDSGHLPPVRSHVEPLGALELAAPLAPASPDRIGDLTVHERHAYVASGRADGSCAGGGVFVVDAADPASPVRRSFVAARAGNAVAGAPQALAVATAAFTGDLLAFANRDCGGAGRSGGGFDLYDVSDPAQPTLLVANAGYRGGDPGPDDRAASLQRIALWQTGGKLHLAGVDGRSAPGELEIYDASDPREPVLVARHDLVSDFPAVAAGDDPYGDETEIRDVTYERVGSTDTLLVALGDAGVARFDVDDPQAPVLLGDSDFGTSDPLYPVSPPEGNVAFAAFRADHGAIVAGDHDASPFRPGRLSIMTGPNGGTSHATSRVGGAPTAASLQDSELNGPVVYGGYGCDASEGIPLAATALPSPEQDEERIVVLQRGPAGPFDDGCPVAEKVANTEEAGYDAAVIGNFHRGGAGADGADCGAGDAGGETVVVCTTHAAIHMLFNEDPMYEGDDDMPAIGTVGEQVSVTDTFDGWGYVSLYEAAGPELERLDAFAVHEARNPAYAFGFGDLSFSKLAIDPSEPLAYVAWRSAGLRVLSTDGRLLEQGAYIPPDGADFRGVDAFTTTDGRRVVALSDADFGLVLVRPTGPGAPARPSCADTGAAVAYRQAVTISLTCFDANGNALTRRIVSGPTSGTLGPVDQAAGTVTYTHTGAGGGTDSFRFAASDGTAESPPATVSVAVGSAPVTTEPQVIVRTVPGPERLVVLPAPAAPRDVVPPRITGLRATASRIAFALSEPAGVRITVERRLRGRSVGGRCVRQTRRNRSRRACDRFVAVAGALTRAGTAGANAVAFDGTVGGRRLARGAYRVTALATDPAGNRSAPAQGTLTIRR